jgi:hypothetical protein
MKFSKLFFLPFIMGCVLFTSCKTSISTVGKLSLIPGDASIVYELDGNEIFAKSGLNSPDNYRFLNFLKLMSSDASTFIEGFLKNSKDAGIGADKMLLYVSKLPDCVAYLSMLDRKIFEAWLKKAEAPEPTDGGAYSYIPLSTDLTIAWNNDFAVIAYGIYSREQLAGLLKPKSDGLLAVNTDFQKFVSKSSDARMWLKYTSLIDLYENLFFFYSSTIPEDKKSLFRMELENNYANITAHSYLNFEDGKITGSVSLFPATEVEKLKEKFPIFKESFNKEILKDMPEQSYMAANISINVGEYFKLLGQNIEKLAIREFEGLNEGKIKEMTDFLESPAVKSVIGALGGDLLLSIHGFNNGIITYPLASASFTVNGEKAFNDILSLVPSSVYRKQDGYYSISANKTYIPVYFAYKNDKVFVSNDLDAVKVFVDGPKEKTFANNPVSSAMSDKMMLYLNLDYKTYPDNIKIMLQSLMEQGYSIFTSIIDIYEGMYFSTDANFNFEFSLQLKNKNVNSLKQILTNLDQTLSSSWMN